MREDGRHCPLPVAMQRTGEGLRIDRKGCSSAARYVPRGRLGTRHSPRPPEANASCRSERPPEAKRVDIPLEARRPESRTIHGATLEHAPDAVQELALRIHVQIEIILKALYVRRGDLHGPARLAQSNDLLEVKRLVQVLGS